MVNGQIVGIQQLGSRWRVTVMTAAGPYEIIAGAVSGPYQPAVGDALTLTVCR